jgi:hypothetical protein
MGLLSRRRKRVQRIEHIEAELDRARDELARVIRDETAKSAGEIQRLLARERADSLSRLEAEERKIAEERRRDVLEREREAGADLSAKLGAANERMEQRFARWSADLDRTKQSLTAELAKLAERQKVLVRQAEERLQADREKLDETGQLQVAAVQKLREELQRAAETAGQELRAELDAHAAERRRALAPYRLDDVLLDRAAPGAIALHCLPAHPGEEITEDVLYGPRQRIWDQAENRRHAQKALLEFLVSGPSRRG